MTPEAKNKPVAKLRDRDISIAVWENPTKDGQSVRYSAGGPVRSYQDDAGEWQETTSFGRDEWLRIGRLAGKVADRIDELYTEHFAGRDS